MSQPVSASGPAAKATAMTSSQPVASTERAPEDESPRAESDYQIVRSSRILRPLDDRLLDEAVCSGQLTTREVWRDEIVADHGSLESDGEWIYLVDYGQVVVARFDPDILADERAWSAELNLEQRKHKIRPQGPLIHLAEQHLAVFGPGDLFNSRALAVERDQYAFFAALPAQLIAARPSWLGDAAASHPDLGAALGDALRVARDRLDAFPRARSEIVDFYVRQGLSAAGTLRVVQIDRCIECRQCERACADRHGISRLTIPGPRLGLVGFAVTCRTCTDRRCLSVCNFDSIEYDEKLGEVLVREQSCTGCASCANACPYGAIKMIRLDDPENARYRARLERRGSLQAGPEAARREPAEQIASKCDHCIGYDDQACITQCPTGALIEVSPAALFPGAHGSAPSARPTGDPSLPFEVGFRAAHRARRPLLRTVRSVVLWATGLLGLALAAAEIALREIAPQQSLQYWMLTRDGLEPALARFRVGYLAGSGLSLTLGYVGSGLMLLSLVYPLRKRWRPLSSVGSGGTWFDLHVMGGMIGPLYIFLHSAFHLYNWVAIAVWAFVAVVASGLVGRHFLTRLPERFPGKSVAAVQHENEIGLIGAGWPAAATAALAELDRYRRFARLRGSGEPAFLAALVWIAADSFRRPLGGLGRRARLARAGAPAKVRAALFRQIRRAIAAERGAALTRRSAPFLRVWLRIHLLFTVVAVIVSIAHVVAALTYSM